VAVSVSLHLARRRAARDCEQRIAEILAALEQGYEMGEGDDT
jgi:hypothetical protein